MRYFKKQKKIKDSMSKNDKIKLKKSKDKKNNDNKIIIQNMMNKIKKIEKDYDDNGPIYDDCNEIRKKIKAFLGKGLMKHSQFFKILGENLQHNSFNKFMSFGPERLSGILYSIYMHFYIHILINLYIFQVHPIKHIDWRIIFLKNYDYQKVKQKQKRD